MADLTHEDWLRACDALYELSVGHRWPGEYNGIPTPHVGMVTVVDVVIEALGLSVPGVNEDS